MLLETCPYPVISSSKPPLKDAWQLPSTQSPSKVLKRLWHIADPFRQLPLLTAAPLESGGGRREIPKLPRVGRGMSPLKTVEVFSLPGICPAHAFSLVPSTGDWVSPLLVIGTSVPSK